MQTFESDFSIAFHVLDYYVVDFGTGLQFQVQEEKLDLFLFNILILKLFKDIQVIMFFTNHL